MLFPSLEQVPKHLIHHFMRGYFDGDGCITNSNNQLMFQVLGTNDFLNIFEDILLENINRKTKNKRCHDNRHDINTESIHYGGNLQCKKIFDFLYKDATIYLQRKYDKFNN